MINWRIVVLTCLGLMIASVAHAERRIALVIGNGAYEAIGPLKNPRNDARLLTKTLESVGFEVTTVLDADQSTMKRAMLDFGRKLRGDVDVSLFYYSGHGFQTNGRNYLVPVAALIEDETEADLEAVDVDAFLATIESASSKVNIVVLDACRNNPFARSFRSATRGLSMVSAPSGTFVAYSTAPGSVAEDGEGENSTYSAALSAAILKAGLKVEETFKDVRQAVLEKSKGKQVPWDTSSLVGDFYFRPAPGPASPPPQLVPNSDSMTTEVVFWNSIADSNDPNDYEAYLNQFPRGPFASLARNRLASLQPPTETPAAKPTETPAAKQVPKPGGAPLRIATAGPMTGPYASFGAQMKTGIEQAIADLNAEGGILGMMLVTEIGDDGCDPQQAEAVANQLASKGAAFVAGHFCSRASIPASAVYAGARIVQISPASTSPAFTDDRPGPGTFRVSGRDDVQGKIAGAYIAANFKGEKVAIIDDKSPYGKGLADETRKALNAAGVTEDLNESYDAGDKDFSALVSKLKHAGIEVLYVGGYDTEAALIARQMKDQGMNVQLISGDALVSDEYWQIAGDAAEGTLMTFPADPRKVPAAAAVVKEFTDKGIDPEGYVLYTYAAVQVWAQAAEKAGSIDFAEIVEQLKSNTFDTVLGPIKFDDKGDVLGPASYVWYIWKAGKYAEM